jgi:hypothetical protein
MLVSEAVSSQRVLLQSRFLALPYARSSERRDCFAALAVTEKGVKQSRFSPAVSRSCGEKPGNTRLFQLARNRFHKLFGVLDKPLGISGNRKSRSEGFLRNLKSSFTLP